MISLGLRWITLVRFVQTSAATLTFLDPVRISVHTDDLESWYVNPCNGTLTPWPHPSIQLVLAVPSTNVSGRTVSSVHHQADLLKLHLLKDSGGIVQDFDVFLLKGKRLRQLLRKHECVLSQEGRNMLNAGFAACRAGAQWPAAMLEQYEKDYRPDNWLYNSAILPFEIYKTNASLAASVFVDNTISNNPSGKDSYRMLRRNGQVDWKSKLGYHSFYEDCDLDRFELRELDTSFGHLLRWILSKSERTQLTE